MMNSIRSHRLQPQASLVAQSRKISLNNPRIIHGVGSRTLGTRRILVVTASEKAGRLLSEGKRKYENGDPYGALLLWEDCIKQDPDLEQRQAALFNATCVHAGFGDVELAQIMLRDAVQCGLDFKLAAENPSNISPDLVKLVASQQVLIRLRKFNEAILKKAGAAAPPPFSSTTGGGGGGGTGSSGRSSGGFASASSKSAPGGARRKPSILEDDLSKMLETDMQGIDTSVFGILRRVAVLLFALSGLGAVLFYVGLKYMFPEN